MNKIQAYGRCDFHGSRRALFRSLFLRLVPDEFDQLAGARGLSHLLSMVKELDSAQIWELASPFFWSTLEDLLYDLDIGTKASTECAALRFGLNALDSFWSYASVGTEILVTDAAFSELGLANLGLYFSSTIPFTLRKSQCDLVEVAPAHGAMQQHCVEGRQSSNVIKRPAGNLFSSDIAALVETNLEEVQAFTRNYLPRAFDVIETVDPALHARISCRGRFYVNLASNDIETHHSFTAAELPSVSFLSTAKDEWRLAEAIVHEFYHDQLNMITEVEAAWDNSCEQHFYSPWRDDPRPISGLFHAIFVFGGVFQFLSMVPAVRQTNFIARRRIDVLHKLRVALMQVPKNNLTALGQSIMLEVRSIMERWSADISDTPVPSAVEQHAMIWKTKNPTLAWCPSEN